MNNLTDKVILVAISALVSYGIAEIYRQHIPQSIKKNWENFINMHHGEAGIHLLSTGISKNDPVMIGSGVGLAVHDHNDINKWFKSITNEKYLS